MPRSTETTPAAYLASRPPERRAVIAAIVRATPVEQRIAMETGKKAG